MVYSDHVAQLALDRWELAANDGPIKLCWTTYGHQTSLLT